jgi:hypothetical protein
MSSGPYLRSVVAGYVRYYGVPLNSRSITPFRFAVGGVWRWVLERRSQRTRIPRSLKERLIERWLPPAPATPCRSYSSASSREVGAECGSTARPDLRRRRATAVSTLLARLTGRLRYRSFDLWWQIPCGECHLTKLAIRRNRATQFSHIFRGRFAPGPVFERSRSDEFQNAIVFRRANDEGAQKGPSLAAARLQNAPNLLVRPLRLVLVRCRRRREGHEVPSQGCLRRCRATRCGRKEVGQWCAQRSSQSSGVLREFCRTNVHKPAREIQVGCCERSDPILAGGRL